MVTLTTLWLPILLSAIVVFIVSSIIHMLIPWHKNDYPKIPNEDKVMDGLRPFNIPPGDYMMPRASSTKEMNSPEFKEKMEKGPVMIVTVKPNGKWGMTPNLILWFIYSLVISYFSAYLAVNTFHLKAVPYLNVFKIVGIASFMGYAIAIWQMSIWYGRSWKITITTTIDGLIYALFTAGVFGWLWPR